MISMNWSFSKLTSNKIENAEIEVVSDATQLGNFEPEAGIANGTICDVFHWGLITQNDAIFIPKHLSIDLTQQFENEKKDHLEGSHPSLFSSLFFLVILELIYQRNIFANDSTVFSNHYVILKGDKSYYHNR